MSERERLQKAVVATRAAYYTACDAVCAAWIDSTLVPYRTYVAELAAVDDAADAWGKTRIALSEYLKEQDNE